MGFNPVIPVGNLVAYSRGGGWGKETPFEGSSRVAIIRGADFPSVAQGSYGNLPVRYEKDSKVNSVALRAGDIVLENSGGTVSRPTGRTVFVTNELIGAYDCPVIPASFCRLLRFDNRANSEFVYYWLQEMYSAGRTWGYQNRSTGLSNFQYKVFADSELLPDLPIEVQSKIASVLSAFEKKIRENNRQNGYLEELLLAKYDKLFPANADFTGILSDVGTVVGGATPSKKRSEYYCSNGIGWITPRDLSNTSDKFIAHGADDITDEGYASCSAKLLPKGSVLFSSRAPIGYVAIATNEVATNQGFKSVVPKEEIGTAFVYCFLVRNKQRIADMGAGTTFPEVSGKMMKSVELAVPEQSLCAEFDVFAEPILKQQETLERENRDLAALRNALLPKLMSGEIDVSKVDLTQLNSHLS